MSKETKHTQIEMDNNVKTNEMINTADGDQIKSTETSNTVLIPPVHPHQTQSAEILKLFTDCFEELFEYFPLKDILCMGQTCKRLHQIVLYTLRQYYSGAELLLPTANDLRIGNVDEINICITFIEFAQRVSVYCSSGFHYLNQIQSKFCRLRHIHLHLPQINIQRMNGLKEILEKLEVLQLSSCEIIGNVHETILAFCPNIKRLGFMECTFETDTNEIDLFRHEYPSLEHFELVFNKYGEHSCNGLQDFLKLNPNIRSLSVSCQYWTNSTPLMPGSADIHLEELAVSVSNDIDVEFVRVIQELYERDFHRRLKLYIWNSSLIQDNIDHLATLKGFKKLYLGRSACKHSIAISELSSLEELCLYDCNQITDLETAAINLSMLGRIHFQYASLDDIWPFTKHARRVKRIKVDHLMEGIHFSISNNVINLVALNEEREKLAQEKVTIYVKEKVYLATKWALREMDYSSIRLKREESYEWTHDFEGFLQ